MSSNFQFAFLGCQNNYLASVTELITSERPAGPSDTETYGLPDAFAAGFKEYSRKKYFFNIRGHDPLSHIGRWHTLNNEGNVKACSTSHAEIEQLQSIALENAAKARNSRTAIMNVTFGPKSGSFFADVCESREYMWDRLPRSLEIRLQRLLTRTKLISRGTYGKIYDIAMNASEGWVLLLKQGKEYESGGKLPPDLERALQRGRERKAAISHIFLNHQNPNEYVLLFSDGVAHVALHEEFHDPVRRLLKLWAANRKLSEKFRFYPRSTCAYPKPYQRTLNASYYNARGLFHLSRGNALLALSYFNEAHEQNRGSDEIHLNLGMALVAVRQSTRDEVLEAYLATEKEIRPNPVVLREGEMGSFRISYVGMEARGWDIRMLERGLNTFMAVARGRANEEWRFGMIEEVEEIWAQENVNELQGSPIEPRTYSHELRGADDGE
ncbi:hypothetical protein VTL71DRAFT_2814 [Oculimacula yallundae]|uniref:Uncharacterized protein n=1 Tax=Oculimacula yallundae TaxID=86028 RepID=A0ABR4C9W9_9HELO